MVETQKITRPALRYRGGKWRIAPWVIEHFPANESYECYCEPYMGAGSVLLQKPPSDFEVLNDLDGWVVAFFRVLRDRPADLAEVIQLTPCAREELAQAYQPVEGNGAAAELEKARRLYMRCWQGRGSANRKSGWRFQKSWTSWRMNYPELFKRLGHFGPLAERLAKVQIDNGDALDCIRRFDGPTTLFYVDPPYVMDLRDRPRDLYGNELADRDHEELAGVLHEIEGMALVSGYPCDLYDRLYAGWRTVSRLAYAESQKETTECLWISPAAERAQAQGNLLRGVE